MIGNNNKKKKRLRINNSNKIVKAKTNKFQNNNNPRTIKSEIKKSLALIKQIEFKKKNY